MTQEALKLALEALETPWNSPYVDGCDLALGKRVKAITAIKEALAQTQEPVAHWSDCAVHSEPAYLKRECDCGGFSTPPQPEQEPMQFKIVVIDNHHPNGIPYEHWVKTPQRTWVGLTDDEMTHTNHHMVEGAYQYSFKQGALWAEAKLKEKNT